ncbi:MAG: 4'-phosphopantetheinyl transferase superfamily protein [Candidatus Omnitrophica bacterium]|nr:4'-phosphopantetheinyl transferase superfamily protein [Candidatus Omnitrophota bacterium]
MSAYSVLCGIGVDMVSLSRAGDFYRRHRESLKKILCGSELKQMEQSRSPERLFGWLFAAKEAVFKSLDAEWLGIDGFRMIEVRLPSTPKGFGRARLKGSMAERVSSRMKVWRIYFLETAHCVIAQAMAFARVKDPER